MAKKFNTDNIIGKEILSLEDKVKEFQDYLKLNKIISKVTNGSEILLSEENQDKLHKEIVVQIRMQDAIFNWLPLLKKLREIEDDTAIETRGDIPISGLFKKKKDE